MKRKNNGIIIVSLLLCAVIIFLTAGYIKYYKEPYKEPIEIELEKVNKEDTVMLNAGSKQIYVTNSTEGVVVVGADGKIFSSIDNGDYEVIYITGNFPKELDESLSKRVFILNGEYIGRKTVKGETPERKTFKVDNWDILDEVNMNKNKSENDKADYLTKSDYCGNLKMTTNIRDLYELGEK